MAHDRVVITEQEFRRHERERLRAFADEVAEALEDFQTSARAVALDCNLDPRLVRRALHGIRINGECEHRIRYWIERQRRLKR